LILSCPSEICPIVPLAGPTALMVNGQSTEVSMSPARAGTAAPKRAMLDALILIILLWNEQAEEEVEVWKSETERVYVVDECV
jgi:hypothetical protein